MYYVIYIFNYITIVYYVYLYIYLLVFSHLGSKRNK